MWRGKSLWPFESSLAIVASAAHRANVRRQPITFHPRIACFGERTVSPAGIEWLIQWLRLTKDKLQ